MAPFICDQICVNVPDGDYVCICQDGYQLEADGHNCTGTTFLHWHKQQQNKHG